MTHAARVELANAIRDRYVAAAVKDKRRILEEFIAATGYHEKSAIRALNAYFSDRGRPFQPDRGRRCSVMADDHRGARATG
jgi:hypothetical protein